MRKRLRHPGTVTAITQHHSHPNFVRISVAHGPKKKAKKGEPTSYDDRPTSELTLPSTHAAGVSLGDRVNVGMGGSSMMDEDGDEMAPMRRLKKSAITPGRVY